jgi:PPOX class probable F420-dependent enzyme
MGSNPIPSATTLDRHPGLNSTGMTPDERRQFLESHRLAVLGVERARKPPHLSPVYYALDGEDLIVSVTKARVKTRLIRRAGGLSLCVMHEEFPFPYLRVEGRGFIEEDGAVDLMMRIGEKMRGQPVPESARPAVEERAKNEQRVVLRLTPEAYYP